LKYISAPEELTKSSSERLKKRNILVPSIGPPKPYRERQPPPTTSKSALESRPLPSPPAQEQANNENIIISDRRFSPLPPTPANDSAYSVEDHPPSPLVNQILPSSESPESRPVSYYSTVAAEETSEGLYSSVVDDEIEAIRQQVSNSEMRQQVSGSELPVTVRYSDASSPLPPTTETPPPTGPREDESPQVEVSMSPLLSGDGEVMSPLSLWGKL